jgi:hypothetical protein
MPHPLTLSLLQQAARVAEEQFSIIQDASSRDLDQDRVLVLLAELGRRQAELRRVTARIAAKSGLPSGAKARLLRYLQLTRGKIVEKDELSGVSGIYEWARRLRELRTEDGWRIASHEHRSDLRPGQYVLEAGQPDDQLKDAWRLANQIRRSGGSASSRLLAFLRANVGRPVSGEQLAYVTRIHTCDRRIRELVDDGWNIQSHLDRQTLEPGAYVLLKDRRDRKGEQIRS